MNTVSQIGAIIAKLRKDKGATQEELAKYVGVSAQAVSKWENGGVPDTELLPKIADYFSVSLDSLFGRHGENKNIYKDLFDFIKQTEPESEERFKTAFELCWEIERAVFSWSKMVANADEYDKGGTIADYEKEMGEDEQLFSSIITNNGFTRMGIANPLQYFLLVPEIKDKEKALFQGIDYTEFFALMADKDIFNAFIMLNKRDFHKYFTKNLFIKQMGFTEEQTEKIFVFLRKYRLISTTKLEMDDEILETYSFKPSPSLIALLIFAKEIICPPQLFSFHASCRGKPFLT